MNITRVQLEEDLLQAYMDARRHKRHKPYQRFFESNLENNLSEICDSLLSRHYKPLPSDCFIISDPKKREVFAAHFRDRVVHHLYYNYTHRMFERTFIHDSYSCIKGRGTHFGVERLRRHILSESHSHARPCYVLKMDIRGYFMHINRRKLCEIAIASLSKMATHPVGKYRNEVWGDVVDLDFLHYLTREITLLNPISDCRIIGLYSEWDDLPPEKSLFHSPDGCGLPIGNLTSQLFSNVYLNEFDQYMKRKLHCRHYGRYVDDFYVVSNDRDWLASLIPHIAEFLKTHLGLEVHQGKTQLVCSTNGIEFLGAFVLPYRTYISRSALQRMDAKLSALETASKEMIFKSLNSYCGILSHDNNYNLRRTMLLKRHNFTSYGMFDFDVLRFFI